MSHTLQHTCTFYPKTRQAAEPPCHDSFLFLTSVRGSVPGVWTEQGHGFWAFVFNGMCSSAQPQSIAIFCACLCLLCMCGPASTILWSRPAFFLTQGVAFSGNKLTPSMQFGLAAYMLVGHFLAGGSGRGFVSTPNGWFSWRALSSACCLFQLMRSPADRLLCLAFSSAPWA